MNVLDFNNKAVENTNRLIAAIQTFDREMNDLSKEVEKSKEITGEIAMIVLMAQLIRVDKAYVSVLKIR